jgi:glycerol-3-phosphate acyltransferase PlsY
MVSNVTNVLNDLIIRYAMLSVILWTAIGFLLGSIPFSWIIGKVALKKDIRNFCDGNPGATSVLKLGGWKVGLFALSLDLLKGVIPAYIANSIPSVSDLGIVPVALSPVAGHAFTPFLKFKGGKAIAATYGMWIGLTCFKGPIILGVALSVMRMLVKPYAWALLIAMVFLLFFLVAYYKDINLIFIWIGNFLILVYKHRRDIKQPLQLQSYPVNFLKH